MHAVIDRCGKGWNFTLKQGDVVVYSSSSPSTLYYGEYEPFYDSPEAAFGACRMFMFRNAGVMDRVEGKETMTEVQQGIVDGMVHRWNAFIARMKDIRHDEENEQRNELQKTVPSLEKLLSDSIRTIDTIVPEIERDTSEEAVLEENREFDEKNVDNEASVYLLRLQEKMKKMRKRLKEDFNKILEKGALPEGPAPPPVEPTASARALTKHAGLLKEDPDLLANIMADHVEAVRDSLGGGYVRDISRKPDDGWLFLIKTTKGQFGVRIGDDAIFRGMFPAGRTCAEYPHMSLAFWNDILKPAMAAVGHWLDDASGHLVLPETVAASVETTEDGSKVVDVLKGFNTRTREKCACEMLSKRGRRVKGDMCRVRSRRLANVSASNNLEARIGRLKNATMAKVVDPDSKYQGIAGPVDPERMKVRNDYIEVPVRIKYDTGLETEIWMADDQIEVFMEGGDGTPQTID